jgi:hypothetical protein
MPDLAGLLAGAATELDRFDSDPGPLLTVQDGVDAKVQESAEYRGITCDQRGSSVSTTAKPPRPSILSRNCRKLLPSAGDHFLKTCKARV